MATKHILIVGNGIAGTTTALTLREQGFAGAITLVSDEPFPAYYRTRLPEVLFEEIDLTRLYVAPPDRYAEKNITLRLQTRIESIDAQQHVARTAKGEDIPFDDLVLATGSQAYIPPIPGARELKGIFTLRSLEDARTIREAAEGKKKVVCLGGGLLGLEIAYHLHRLGLQVEIVEGQSRLLPCQLDMKSGHILQSILEKKGMSFHLNSRARMFFGDEAARGLEIDGKGAITGDLFVITAGARPRRPLLDQLGLRLDRGLVIDENGRTSLEHVYAAGDHVQFHEHVWGTWLAARFWGKRVGEVLAGNPQPFALPAETFRLKVSGIELLSMGNMDLDGQGETDHRAVCHILGCNPEEGKYFKVVEEMGHVTGTIILGNFPKTRQVENAVKEGYPWVNLASEFGLQDDCQVPPQSEK